MSRSNLQIKTEGDVLSFQLPNRIDEKVNYSNINASGINAFEFDFCNVELLNSTGVKNLMVFIKSLPTQGSIEFINVPNLVVEQMNIFSEFVKTQNINFVSFEVPYYCESCDKQFFPILTPRDLVFISESEGWQAPEIRKCEVCEKDMEYDNLSDLFKGLISLK